MDLALLIARLVFGVLIAMHGAQKLFGWFGGYGLSAVSGFFESLGFRPGRLFAVLASTSELFAGLLIVLGLLGPVGPALMVSVMIVAAVSVHWHNGLFASTNGIEVPLLNAAAGTAFALTGMGRYSLDFALRLTPVWTPAIALVALAVAVVAAVVNLGLRRTAPAQAAA